MELSPSRQMLCDVGGWVSGVMRTCGVGGRAWVRLRPGGRGGRGRGRVPDEEVRCAGFEASARSHLTHRISTTYDQRDLDGKS